MAEITSLLGRKEPIGSMLDSRRFSVVLTGGSILDLLNAVAKADGGFSWMWEEHSARERMETGCSLRSECGDVWRRKLPGLLHPVSDE